MKRWYCWRGFFFVFWQGSLTNGIYGCWRLKFKTWRYLGWVGWFVGQCLSQIDLKKFWKLTDLGMSYPFFWLIAVCCPSIWAPVVRIISGVPLGNASILLSNFAFCRSKTWGQNHTHSWIGDDWKIHLSNVFFWHEGSLSTRELEQCMRSQMYGMYRVA